MAREMTIPADDGNWDIVISSKKNLFELKFRELWRYRDLLMLFVWRDYTHVYKQSILGPLWYVIQPLFMTITFTIIFGNIAKIPTDGIPPMLFYMSGVTLWTYFADCLNKTATTFKDNQQIFGKVYFTRMVVPVSIVISNLIKFGIQVLLFFAIYLYFIYSGAPVAANAYAFLFPLLVVMLAGLGLGFGLVVTSLTVKYRDLVFLLQFGIQLAMYATPVIYPLSEVPEKYRLFAVLNPMTSIIETFKYGFLGEGIFSWGYLGYSFLIMLFLLLAGTAVFNRTEKNFMDIV